MGTGNSEYTAIVLRVPGTSEYTAPEIPDVAQLSVRLCSPFLIFTAAVVPHCCDVYTKTMRFLTMKCKVCRRRTQGTVPVHSFGVHEYLTVRYTQIAAYAAAYIGAYAVPDSCHIFSVAEFLIPRHISCST